MQARKRTGMQLCDHQMCPEEPGFLRAPDFDDDNISNDDELLFALLALLTNWRHSEDSLEFKLLKWSCWLSENLFFTHWGIFFKADTLMSSSYMKPFYDFLLLLRIKPRSVVLSSEPSLPWLLPSPQIRLVLCLLLPPPLSAPATGWPFLFLRMPCSFPAEIIPGGFSPFEWMCFPSMPAVGEKNWISLKTNLNFWFPFPELKEALIH